MFWIIRQSCGPPWSHESHRSIVVVTRGSDIIQFIFQNLLLYLNKINNGRVIGYWNRQNGFASWKIVNFYYLTSLAVWDIRCEGLTLF